MQADPCEPLLLLPLQRKTNTRTPSPSNCNHLSQVPLLPNGSTFRTSVTQQRRERRAEKLERKRIRKKEDLDYRLSLLNIDSSVFSADAFGTYDNTPTTPNSKADGVVVALDSSSSIVVTTTTTNNITTTSTTTTTNVTTTTVTSSPRSEPPPDPAVLAFFESKKSYLLRQDFHLYGNITNRFLFEKCIQILSGAKCLHIKIYFGWFLILYYISQVKKAEYWWILSKQW